MGARHVRRVRVNLGERGLSTRQALFGRGQQPFHRLRPVAFDGITVVVQSIGVEDAEIALGSGVARFGG